MLLDDNYRITCVYLLYPDNVGTIYSMNFRFKGATVSQANNNMDSHKIEQGVRLILEGIGEDLSREGLVDTPSRVARSMQEIFAGLHQSPDNLFNVTFNVDSHDMVVVKDIPFYSMCEHHLLPFYGHAHIGYIPSDTGKVCGLSKLARCVEVFARRPQIQERMTQQIAQAVQDGIDAKGVIVVVEAEHMCMSMRGVSVAGAQTRTIKTLGTLTEGAARRDALSFLGF